MSPSKTITLPALIDCHVHFREPGFPEKATMQTEADSAHAGGVGTVCEMPNTNPPTVTIAALADKVRRANEIKNCDIRFFFGVTEEAHLLALRELWTGESEELRRLKKRCCGVKVYFDHSTGNQGVDMEIIDEIFKTCAELKIPLVGHCEDAAMNAQAMVAASGHDIVEHSYVRSPESEEKSVNDAINLAKKHGTAFHVAHLSTSGALENVRRAKKEGLPVTCEVAPHHLFLTVDDYPTLGTLGKMNPPLRSKGHQKALWEGVMDGTVDCIATDHAPHTLAEKKDVKNPFDAPSGVPGVETMLPLLLSVVSGHWPHPRVRNQDSGIRFSVDDIVRLCFTNPNRIFNLGKIGEEKITVDLDQEWVINGSDLHSKCGWTPYEGWRVVGRVVDKES